MEKLIRNNGPFLDTLYIRHQTQIPLHLRVLDLKLGRKIAKSLQDGVELKPYLKCVVLDKFFQPVHDKEMPIFVIRSCITVEANPQQENNFVFLSPFHSIFVIYTPSMLSERVSVSSCSEKETMCFVTR